MENSPTSRWGVQPSPPRTSSNAHLDVESISLMISTKVNSSAGKLNMTLEREPVNLKTSSGREPPC